MPSTQVGCDFCKNEYINNYTPARPTLPVNVVPGYGKVWWNSTLSPVSDGCIPPAFEFSMYYPTKAALNGTESADEFYGEPLHLMTRHAVRYCSQQMQPRTLPALAHRTHRHAHTHAFARQMMHLRTTAQHTRAYANFTCSMYG